MSERKTLVLIDGHALAFRAFHALKDQGLRSSGGEPTYAVFGFMQIMLTALQDLRPEYVAVSFDVGRTFRHEADADYKANRSEAPEEFQPQLERIKEVVAALNIPIHVAPGFEADDVIGTLARQAAAIGVDTIIVTGDTDTLQLVDDHTRVLLANPHRAKAEATLYDLAKVQERYKGLRPDQLADLRGLKGDTSDNIPGVKGIGETGAIQLLEQYGTVEAIYEHLEDVPNRYRKALEGQDAIALKSKWLATIDCKAPVTLELDACELCDYDRDSVVRLFQQLEFRSLLKKLPAPRGGVETVDLPALAAPAPGGAQQLAMFDLGEVKQQAKASPLVALPAGEVAVLGDYTAVVDEAALDALCERLAAAPCFAFDTEGTSTDSLRADLCGISLAVEPGSGWYVPVGHATGEPQLPLELVVDRLRPFFQDPEKGRCAHHAKFDMEMLSRAGIEVPSVSFDTMVAAALLGRQNIGLKDLVFNELGLEMTNIEELIGKGKAQITMDKVEIARATPYAAADADMTFQLMLRFQEELARPDQEKVKAIFERMEIPLVPVLVAIEQAGITLEVPYLQQLNARVTERLGDIEQQIYQHAGAQFNINSGQQLADVLFSPNRLAIPSGNLARTKTGQISLTADVLEQLRSKEETNHPIIGLILEHRQLTKLRSTYIEALPGLVNPETGRVHTSYNQVGAATGRLSCLPAGTLVNTHRGLVGIEEVREGDLVRTTYGPRRVDAWLPTGVKPIIALKLSNGITLRCSPEHRIRSKGEWVEAKDLDVGAPLYMSLNKGMFGNEVALDLKPTASYVTRKTPPLPDRWTRELAELVGYHMADGHIARSNYNDKPAKVVLAFGWDDDELIEYFAAIIPRFFGKEPVKRITKSCPVLEVSGVDIGGALEQLGAGGKSGLIRVPSSLFRAPEQIVAAFLRGYFEGDGTITPTGIAVRSVSYGMLSDVQQLLTMFGIASSISIGTPDPDGRAPRHTLFIMGRRSKQVFATHIGFLSGKKAARCEELVYGARDRSRAPRELLTLPGSFDINELKPYIYAAYRDEDGRIPTSWAVFTSKIDRGTSTMALRRAESIVKTLPEENPESLDSVAFLQEAVWGQYYEVEIEEISYDAPKMTYDIAVRDMHQFLAQGIVVSNSANPNLQNIPIRTEIGREIRRAFVAAPGHVLLSADYSQVELRVLAHVTQDPALIDAFTRDLDIHTATASRIFSVQPEEVNKNHRRMAKMTIFGIIYGISAFGLSSRLGTSRQEAAQLIEAVFEQFPGIRDYIDATTDEAKRNGFVHTLFGRRRYFPELKGGGGGPRKQAAEREAINAPIQGTSADLIKLAMVRLYDELRARKLKTRILLQVHDELVLEVPDAELAQVRTLVRSVMEGVYPELRVPLKVDVEYGRNWESMQEGEDEGPGEMGA